MKILLVEDEIGIVDFLKQGLEEEMYSVDVALEGEKGYNLALSEKYDLLILDWMLPQKSGIEICKSLREAKINTPIIFLTAKDTIQETVEGLEAGANDYIKKPFSFDELLVRIKVQLRSKPIEPKVLSLGDIIIDTDAFKVLNNGLDVSLTKKEFDLLVMLIKNKGKVCKRKDIIKTVWEIHFDYDTSVIDVYINSLRKKIKSKESESFIETIRGVGYMVKEL